jgi:hypothetical protein
MMVARESTKTSEIEKIIKYVELFPVPVTSPKGLVAVEDVGIIVEDMKTDRGRRVVVFSGERQV